MPIPKRYRYDISGVAGSGCAVNVVTGARSFGKTYGWKKFCIKNFIKTGQTWGYLRTFDQEIKDIVADGQDAFFSDIMRNDEFPGYRFRVLGRTMQCGRMVGKDKKGNDVVKWETMGQLLALTKAQSYKGKTVANMHWLIFDEFIRETRVPPYPANAPEQLVNLWETLDRRENRLRIVMLANTADVVNPYFVAWHIVPPEPGRHIKVPVGKSFVYVENCWSADFEKYAEDSEIGKFTSGSAYAEYAQKNKFQNVTGFFVKKRNKRSRPQMNVKWQEQVFSIWVDLDELGIMYVEKGEVTGVDTICLTKEDASPNIYVIERNHPYLKDLVSRGRKGWLYCDSDSTRERFWQVLELCGFH